MVGYRPMTMDAAGSRMKRGIVRRSLFPILSVIGAALLISTMVQTALGQPPELKWEKTFGGAGDERGLSLLEGRDSGLIVAGYTGSKGAGERDVFLIKTDKEGEVVWERTIGGPGRDEGWALVETSDGFAIAGVTDSGGSGKKDLLLVKTDAEGYEKWKKTYGGAGDDWGVALLYTRDGFIVAGVTTSGESGGSDGWIVKTDPDGNGEWEVVIGGSKDDGFSSMVEVEGGYVLAGTTESYGAGGKDVWLVKTDLQGERIWEKTFGKGSDERGNSIIDLGDGLLVVGVTEDLASGGRDLFLVKTDYEGEKLWEKTLGGTGDDGGMGAVVVAGGIVILGHTDSQGMGSQDLWLLKVSFEGDELWEKTFAGTGFDLGRSIVSTKDGKMAVAGWTKSGGSGGEDLWLLKTQKPK
ncbi:hypothetical protein [Candidatus Methanocrinis natronophilus]|uniref:Uncharacterized protein n=1 Tax=Candidatus Methanocrinis natronophilus TaxID=3033396 RepID=A0ABT5X538_9EURY|nr:hypothetical protein [Candidatus Methanocrinis natronophilus]MDF0589818.1 hypothetical protein [Candidatus Methanocrinis natronophilus]